jgi:hypothetical protein
MLYNPKPAALAAPYIIGLTQLAIAICMAAIAWQMPTWFFVDRFVMASTIAGALTVGTLSTYMAMRYNAPKTGWEAETDLHLWTQLEQMALSVPLLLAGWPGIIALICSIYPAVFLQKAGVNRMLESSIWDNQTDDATGQYYSIPSLKIKIPRTTQRFRAWMAVLSILAFLIKFL